MKSAILKVLSLVCVLALCISFFPAKVEADFDGYPEKDVDMRLEPHYSAIIYTLDPIESKQRFDDKGDWYWPTTTTLSNSSLYLYGATNASLGVSNDANIDDGFYYEIRIKAGTGANASMNLKDAGASDSAGILMGANGYVYGSYTNATGTVYSNTTVNFSVDTWYRLGIQFSGTAGLTFYCYYDNYTIAGSTTVTDANLTYSEIDELELAQSVAAKETYIDYFVQTSKHTELTPVGQSSKALRIAYDKEVERKNIAFCLDDIKDVYTLSNDTTVETAIGYSPSGRDITTDNKLNMSDIGELLMEQPEDVDMSFRGTSEIKGYDSLYDSVEESLEEYLSARHDGSRVYVVDYYIDDMKVNVTANDAMADKIEKSAVKNWMDIAGDEGAEINYDDDSGLWTNWKDYDYAYMPRDITGAKFVEMKEDLSNQIRKDTVSLVALTMTSPGNITDPMWDFSLTVVRAMSVTGDLDPDTTFQMTNAFIGNVLRGYDYTSTDAEDLDGEMAGDSASGWNMMDDGKTTTSGFSLVTVHTYNLLWIVVVIVLVISAIVIAVLLLKKKKKKGKSSKKK